jgi:Schlafen, AlbA_2
MGLRDDFEAITLDTIRGFVNDGREEDLHLDFKNVVDPALARDDRKTLATAVSGFANSDGGIIVWGIDARPNAHGVDCASALREIPNVQLCLTRLNEFTGQCVSPIVDGVIHKAVPSSGAAGLCASLIPSSDSGPHMAKGGEDRYYKRSGSAFYRLEHFDVADMFGRRRRPLLTLRLQKEGHGASVLVVVKNDGRGIAKAPYLAVDLPQGFRASAHGFDGNGRFGLRQIGQYGNRCFFGGDAGTVIHVGQELFVTRLETTAQTPDGRPAIKRAQRFSYELGAEDVDLMTGALELDY